MFDFNLKGFSASFNSQFVGRQYIDNTSTKNRSIDPYFVNSLRVGYVFKPKFIKEIGVDVTINNLFNEKYETNAWVYSYIENGTLKKMTVISHRQEPAQWHVLLSNFKKDGTSTGIFRSSNGVALPVA